MDSLISIFTKKNQGVNVNIKRRIFLKGTLASGTVAVAVGAGLLTPGQVLAKWPETAFGPHSLSEALKNLHGSDALIASDKVEIEAPDIAENGAVVPITVKTSLDNIESIQILVEQNTNSPLSCSFDMTSAVAGPISTRVKMGKTSDVIAVVKSGGKLYSTRKEVKVTIGGCGG